MAGDPNKALTPKERRFVAAYLSGQGGAAGAYRQAYSETCSPETARVEAFAREYAGHKVEILEDGTVVLERNDAALPACPKGGEIVGIEILPYED